MKSKKEIKAKLQELKTHAKDNNSNDFCPLCGLIIQEQSCITALYWVLGLDYDRFMQEES